MEQDFVIKDSGKRKEFASGMVRDVTTDKIDWTLALDGPMFKRYAIHLTKGAIKYAKRNWLKANSAEELEHAKESATRHFMQWLAGDTDEDHASALIFNLNAVERLKELLAAKSELPPLVDPNRITVFKAERGWYAYRACDEGKKNATVGWGMIVEDAIYSLTRREKAEREHGQ